MIKKILCATDFGVYSSYLLQHALAIAAPIRAQVDVLHVVEPMGLFAESIIETYLPESEKKHLRQVGVEQVMSSIKERVMVMLEGELVESETGACVLGRVHVVSGGVASAILERAKSVGADLIVIGSSSTHGVSHDALGGVAHKVCQSTRVPVMLVPISKVPMG